MRKILYLDDSITALKFMAKIMRVCRFDLYFNNAHGRLESMQF